jgi:hypothetical protein
MLVPSKPKLKVHHGFLVKDHSGIRPVGPGVGSSPFDSSKWFGLFRNADINSIRQQVAATLICGVLSSFVGMVGYLGFPALKLLENAVTLVHPYWGFPHAAGGDKYTIVVAQFSNDTDNSQTATVTTSLSNAFDIMGENSPVQLIRLNRNIAISGDSGDVREQMSIAENEGQDWLQHLNADLLVWGSVVETSKVLRVHLLPRELHSKGGPKSVEFTRTVELPADFIQYLYNKIGESITVLTEGCYCDISERQYATIQAVENRLDILRAYP